jgi:hypothetical protein
MSQLPPGFVIDQQTAAPPQLPPGFVLDDAPAQRLAGASAPMAGRGAVDQLLGIGGSRYQTWPERSVREIAGIPQRAIEAAQSAPAGSREATEAMIGPAAEAAMVFTPSSPAPPVFGMRPRKVAAPTQQELEAAASRGYNAARESGVTVPPEAIAAMQSKIGNELTDQGYLPATAPRTFGVVKEMTPPALKEGESLGPVGVNNIEAMRRAFRVAGKDYAESDASRRAIGIVDDTLSPLSPELATARANSAAGFRAEDIGTRFSRAERQAQKAGSGANVDNALRQKISSILDSKNGTRGYTADEIAQMEKIVAGTRTGNAARLLSKLALSHPMTGWPASVAAGVAGTAAGGPIGGGVAAVASPTIGVLAKMLAEKSTQKQANILDEMVRRRSPLYQEKLAAAPREVPTSIEALVRVLMADQLDKRRPQVTINPRAGAYSGL